MRKKTSKKWIRAVSWRGAGGTNTSQQLWLSGPTHGIDRREHTGEAQSVHRQKYDVDADPDVACNEITSEDGEARMCPRRKKT
jgi:hypothetical protein